MKRIVVLGGYGRTGRALCRMLLTLPDVKVTVAGRRRDAAVEFARSLRQGRAEGEVTACCADASMPETIAGAVAGARLLVVAAPVDGHQRELARACAFAGCDYLDILGSARGKRGLDSMEPEIAGAGRLFITQAGLCPGLPSALTRQVASAFDLCRAVRLGIAISLKGLNRPEQAYGFVDAAADTQPILFRSAAWRGVSRHRERVEIDYGFGPGKRISLPLDLPELQDLPEQAGLEELGAFGATPNWRIDCALRSAIGSLYRLRRGLGRTTIARLLLRAADHSRAPSGATIVAEAWGETRGKEQSCSLRITHCDIFEFTSIAVILFLRQYLDGAFQSLRGIRPMGHILNTKRALLEMPAMGAAVEWTPPQWARTAAGASEMS